MGKLDPERERNTISGLDYRRDQLNWERISPHSRSRQDVEREMMNVSWDKFHATNRLRAAERQANGNQGSVLVLIIGLMIVGAIGEKISQNNNQASNVQKDEPQKKLTSDGLRTSETEKKYTSIIPQDQKQENLLKSILPSQSAQIINANSLVIIKPHTEVDFKTLLDGFDKASGRDLNTGGKGDSVAALILTTSDDDESQRVLFNLSPIPFDNNSDHDNYLQNRLLPAIEHSEVKKEILSLFDPSVTDSMDLFAKSKARLRQKINAIVHLGKPKSNEVVAVKPEEAPLNVKYDKGPNYPFRSLEPQIEKFVEQANPIIKRESDFDLPKALTMLMLQRFDGEVMQQQAIMRWEELGGVPNFTRRIEGNMSDVTDISETLCNLFDKNEVKDFPKYIGLMQHLRKMAYRKRWIKTPDTVVQPD